MTLIAGVLTPGRDATEVCAAIQLLVPKPRDNWLTFAAPGITLAASLLKRLPEDRYDRQPLALHGLHLVGDVRIDNRHELALRLGWTDAAAGIRADSDLFLTAWEKWGRDALRYLVGGFAVAIWNAQTRELTLVRDHVGERTLHFLHAGQTLAFCSLPGPLRAVPGVDTALDEQRMVHYLAIVPGQPTQTFFKNVQQLPVAHILEFRDGQARISRYWHPLDAPQLRYKTDDDYVEAFRERFDQAVAARMRTTGKVGSQLSGGMDSSSVTVTAARLLGQQRLTSFTSVPHPSFHHVNPAGRFGDEGPAAAEVAAMYPNIDHVLVPPMGDIIAELEKMGRIQGQPVFNPLNELWMNSIMDLSRDRGVTVVLQGACGNATLSAGGMVGLSRLFNRGRWLALARLVLLLRRRGHASFRGAATWATGDVLPKWLRHRLSPEIANFNFDFSPLLPSQASAHNLKEKAIQAFFGDDLSVQGFRRQMFDYYDIGFVNVATTLEWGIDMRDPTQDKRIFEYCFSIPVEQYLVGGQTRSLVRRAMRGRLPAPTLARTVRGLQAADWFITMGAALPQLNAELAKIRTSPMAARVLDLDRLGKLLDSWPGSGYDQPGVSDQYHLALARGLSAGNFIRQFE